MCSMTTIPIWRFPKIGVPLNHHKSSILVGFPIIDHPAIGVLRFFRKPPPATSPLVAAQGNEAWCVENLGFAKPLVLRHGGGLAGREGSDGVDLRP